MPRNGLCSSNRGGTLALQDTNMVKMRKLHVSLVVVDRGTYLDPVDAVVHHAHDVPREGVGLCVVAGIPRSARNLLRLEQINCAMTQHAQFKGLGSRPYPTAFPGAST